MKKKDTCIWARLDRRISTLCGKESFYYGEDMKFCTFCGKEIVYKVMPKTLKGMAQFFKDEEEAEWKNN